MLNNSFSGRLLLWNDKHNNRVMPWKGEKDPYKIWISEVILQQTRVDQGLEYYNRFITTFPTVESLAAAEDQVVFKLWEGLGYYSRCRNLLATARFIANELRGKFPDEYEEIIKLKGIGPYTAAAISSFAFNLPYAVLDGNVYRILSRVFGIDEAINTSMAKKLFEDLAIDLLDKKQAGIYNQAIMDFGATVCKPVNPDCSDCPYKQDCFAFQHDRVNSLPVKTKKSPVRKRWFYYFLFIDYKKKISIRKRTSRDIWQDLYEFPLLESALPLETDNIIVEAKNHLDLLKNKYTLKAVSPVFKQQLTHQQISGQFILIELNNRLKHSYDLLWVEKAELAHYAFPGYINKYLNNHVFKAGC